MTVDELLIIEKLSACKYAPGTWTKRFVSDLHSISKANNDYILTEPQREWIYRILYKKREQVPYTYEQFKKHPHCKKFKKVA